MTEGAERWAKGSTVVATLDYLREEHGSETLDRVLERLEGPARRRVRTADPTEDVPYEVNLRLWRAVDREIGEEHPEWAEAAGAFSIGSIGQQHYGGILRKSTPEAFLTQRVSLFRLYYRPGDMEVVEEGAGRIVLRLVGFPEPGPLFCRRQAGGLREALELAGAGEARVRHVRCTGEGDAYCEWELRWS